MNKHLYYTSMAGIISAILLTIWFFAVLIYPFKPVEFKQFKTSNQSIYAGEYIHFTLEFVKNYPIKPQIDWYLVDGSITKLNTGGVNRPLGKQITSSSRLIPKTTPKGKYRLQVDLMYEITPFRKIYYSWQSNEFEVK